MCSVDNTCSAMPHGSSKWAVPHFSLASRDILRDAPSLTYPVNLVARYPRLICGSGHTLDQVEGGALPGAIDLPRCYE